MLKNIIFDFDGVIHNTFEFHLQNVNEYAPQMNLTAEQYRAMHDGNFYRSDNQKHHQHISWPGYALFVEDRQGALRTEQYIQEALTFLADMHKIFLVTSGSKPGIFAYLRNNNIDHLFTDMLFKEDALVKKEKFALLFARHGLTQQDTVFVTDTVGDVHEAREVQLATIAVTFGFHDPARLAQAAPGALVDSWPELVALLTDSAKINALLSSNV